MSQPIELASAGTLQRVLIRTHWIQLGSTLLRKKKKEKEEEWNRRGEMLFCRAAFCKNSMFHASQCQGGKLDTSFQVDFFSADSRSCAVKLKWTLSLSLLAEYGNMTKPGVNVQYRDRKWKQPASDTTEWGKAKSLLESIFKNIWGEEWTERWSQLQGKWHIDKTTVNNQ